MLGSEPNIGKIVMKIHFRKLPQVDVVVFDEANTEILFSVIDSKFSKYRDTYNQNDFGQQWQEARMKMRTRRNRGVSSRLVLIILILTLVFLYIIDFDLSIFNN